MRRTVTAESYELNTKARNAVKAFRDSKPWRGTLPERGEKFAELHRRLCRAYDLETRLVRDDVIADPSGCSGGSFYDERTDRIVLCGRMSVVTYLYCFNAARGVRARFGDRRAALAAAVAVFRHFFPRSFARCRLVDGMLRKAS